MTNWLAVASTAIVGFIALTVAQCHNIQEWSGLDVAIYTTLTVILMAITGYITHTLTRE